MNITAKDIRANFSPEDFRRGQELLFGGAGKASPPVDRHGVPVTFGTVSGTKLYQVELRQYRNRISGHCTCPQFARAGQCKHLAAALLAYAAGGQQEAEQGRRLVETYLAECTAAQFAGWCPG